MLIIPWGKFALYPWPGLQPDHRDAARDLHPVFGVQIESALLKGRHDGGEWRMKGLWMVHDG